MTTYTPPRQASYAPLGTLAFPVLVHASRTLFGRLEYEITTTIDPTLAIWVTEGANGQRLQFEEDQP